MFESLTLTVWVLFLVMPGDIPDIPVSQPLPTLFECEQHEARYPEAPFPLVCRPKHIYLNEMT